ncbi:MAG: DUF2807 domain-containing protein [Sphingobacteriales bacterium]|nr:MAG: DUF2807 domain-containing protein [Sphingobacteriales bacterium]
MKKQSLQFLLLLLVAGFISSCGINGKGDTVIKDKNVSEKFTGISLSVSGDVYVMQGNEQKITVHGQQNIIDVLDLEVNNKTLNIGFKRNNVHNYDQLKFYITTAMLESLNISGSGKIVAVDSIRTSEMDLNISGSGDIEMYKLLATDKVKANISGSGSIKLIGSTNNTNYTISGSGNIRAFELPGKYCDAQISGSGDIETTVSDKLEAHISGSGNIRYKGQPVVNSHSSGSGNVTHVE